MSNQNQGGFDFKNLLPNFAPPRLEVPDYSDVYESMETATREKREREDKSAGHVEATAQALRDILAITQAESEAAKERDRLAQVRDEAAKKRDEAAQRSQNANFKVAVGSLVAAVLAIIAPFVIEALKGWQ